MKFEVTFTNLPSGYAAEFHPKGKEGPLKVLMTGYYTSDDGDKLIMGLDGISAAYLSLLPADQKIEESKISSFLGIVKKDKSGTIHINDVKIIATCIPKKQISAGAAVYKDDIVDFLRAEINNVVIPEDAGFALIISIGWRRVLLFDYLPLHEQFSGKRSFDIEQTLAHLLSYLTGRDRLFVTEKQWAGFFEQQWFPFSSLSTDTIKLMKSYVEHGNLIDELHDEIHKGLNGRCPELAAAIKTSETLSYHRDVLLKAIEHFQVGDFLSCTTMLYPRIEGVLRSWHNVVGAGKRASQENLIISVGTSVDGQPIASSLLLVQKFQEFLEVVYFAGFDPAKIEHVSKHTIGHGIAPQEKLNLKAAMLGLMILEQLVFLMSAGSFKNIGVTLSAPSSEVIR